MAYKFMTLNIWEGGLVWENLIPFLKSQNPDILACQEVMHNLHISGHPRYNSYENIKKELKLDYSFFSPSFSETEEKREVLWGNAVFSRFPIISGKTIFYHNSFGSVNRKVLKNDYRQVPRNMQTVQIDVSGKILNIFNNHGVWDFEGRDTPARLKMGEVIAEQAKNKTNIILAGDFNIDPDTQTIAKIEKYLTSVFASKVKTTFNLKRKKEAKWAGFAVDMIFVSQEIKVVKTYCPQVEQADVSDHLPLIIDFEFYE